MNGETNAGSRTPRTCRRRRATSVRGRRGTSRHGAGARRRSAGRGFRAARRARAWTAGRRPMSISELNISCATRCELSSLPSRGSRLFGAERTAMVMMFGVGGWDRRWTQQCRSRCRVQDADDARECRQRAHHDSRPHSFFSSASSSKRLPRRRLVDVDGLAAVSAISSLLRRTRALVRREQTELPRARVAAGARERGPAAARQLVALEAAEDLLRARATTVPRQAGQSRDLDAVAAIRSAAARSCAGR